MVFLFRLLSLLPLRLLHALGGVLGWIVYWLSPTYRRHLHENLAQAGISPALRGAVAAETGKQIIELARIWMRPLEEAVPLVAEVVGWEHVEAARQAGKGIVFLTPHLGCFEITAQYLSSFGDITVLYREIGRASCRERVS
jgi:KDO2-lipid IV(A) lauroyltransferase